MGGGLLVTHWLGRPTVLAAVRRPHLPDLGAAARLGGLRSFSASLEVIEVADGQPVSTYSTTLTVPAGRRWPPTIGESR